jgi:hypothetical protein
MNPYDPSSPATVSPQPAFPIGPKPQVLVWQKVYLGLMIALYVAVTVAGALLYLFADDIAADDPDTSAREMEILGVIYGVMGLALAILFALGFVFRRGNVGWIFNIILIALGLTSCCTWPATIPLLIFWIKNRNEILHYS